MRTCRLTFLSTTRRTVAGSITATCSLQSTTMILAGSSALQKVKNFSRRNKGSIFSSFRRCPQNSFVLRCSQVSSTAMGLCLWQNTATGRFFPLECIAPHGLISSWSNLISIFAVHLRMGGIFLLAKVCELPRMVFVR